MFPFYLKASLAAEAIEDAAIGMLIINNLANICSHFFKENLLVSTFST